MIKSYYLNIQRLICCLTVQSRSAIPSLTNASGKFLVSRCILKGFEYNDLNGFGRIELRLLLLN